MTLLILFILMLLNVVSTVKRVDFSLFFPCYFLGLIIKLLLLHYILIPVLVRFHSCFAFVTNGNNNGNLPLLLMLVHRARRPKLLYSEWNDKLTIVMLFFAATR